MFSIPCWHRKLRTSCHVLDDKKLLLNFLTSKPTNVTVTEKMNVVGDILQSYG